MADPKVVNAILAEGKRRKRPKLTKAALATGVVESGLRNLPGGDADSQGWRQERASLYPDPTNVKASVKRFFDEAEKADAGKNLPAAEIAARVQRPAAQYRGRYGEADVLAQADKYLKSPNTRKEAVDLLTKASKAMTTTTTQLDSAAFKQAQQHTVLANFIAKRHPNSLLLRTGALSTTEPDIQNFLKQSVHQVSGPTQQSEAASPSRSPSRKGQFKITGPNPKRLKPYLVSFAEKVAGEYGKPLTGSDGTGHSYRTATGGVSQHSTGEATDIPARGKELIRMGRAALIAAGMPRKQAMKQTGGLFNVGSHQIIFNDTKQLSGSPHDDHLHISAKPRRR